MSKSCKKQCNVAQVCNPGSGRCVLKAGKIGRQIQGHNWSTTTKPKAGTNTGNLQPGDIVYRRFLNFDWEVHFYIVIKKTPAGRYSVRMLNTNYTPDEKFASPGETLFGSTKEGRYPTKTLAWRPAKLPKDTEHLQRWEGQPVTVSPWVSPSPTTDSTKLYEQLHRKLDKLKKGTPYEGGPSIPMERMQDAKEIIDKFLREKGLPMDAFDKQMYGGRTTAERYGR